MPPLQVKDCPTETYERLRACAAEQHRSIAQQALTIIEEYLDTYGSHNRENEPAPKPRRAHLRYVDEDYGVDYIAKRRELFKHLDTLPPIPITETAPRSDVILRQIRDEEAR